MIAVLVMCVGIVSSDIFMFLFTDSVNNYSIHLYQTKSCERQVAVFSVSLCQDILW